MRMLLCIITLVMLFVFGGGPQETKPQGESKEMVVTSQQYKITLSPKEERIVKNLKPGQVAIKTIIFASDREAANTIGNCCPKNKCCCTCQCEPKPCICTCTDEIIVK